MRIEITDADLIAGTVKDSVSQRIIRGAAYFLLHSIGDLPDEETVVPTGTSVTRTVSETAVTGDVSHTKTTTVTTAAPPAPPPPPPPETSDDDEGEATPPPPANLGNVPPPPVNTADTSAANATPSTSGTSPAANGAAGAAGVASAETDKNGMPWDERIHQASKGKKKDGSWKLKKIFDSTPEKEAAFAKLVEDVTREHAVKRGAVPPVQLPAGGNSVPVPPVSGTVPTPPSDVPTPPNPGSSSVPVPPSAPVGAMGSSPYTALIDKILTLTKEGKLTHLKVNEMCQLAGATSLQALSNSPHLVPLVDKNIDAAVLGLM